MSVTRSIHALSAVAAVLLTGGLVFLSSAPPVPGPAFVQAMLA